MLLLSVLFQSGIKYHHFFIFQYILSEITLNYVTAKYERLGLELELDREEGSGIKEEREGR